MAIKEETTDIDVDADADADAEQAEISWSDDLINEFQSVDNDEVADEEEIAEDVVSEVAVDDESTDLIGESDYTKQIVIKEKDGTTVHKTVQQLIDEGMYRADWTKKTQELARQREHLKKDQAILDLLRRDTHSYKYLEKRIEDIKAGKTIDAIGDIDIPDEVLKELPFLKKFKAKLIEHDIEISRSRSNTERTQADQTVGKINSVMEKARVAVEKDTGLKLEPDEFRARVGKNILDSLDDSLPEDRRFPVVGQMILTDKDYFLSKARGSYQQEIELAKEKTIDTAKKERADKANKTKSLKGGGTHSPSGGVNEFKMVKDKHGRPDMDAFLKDAFTKGGKTR